MKTINIILLIFAFVNANAQTEPITGSSKNYLSIELDPAPFILGGYSFSLKYSPAKLNHVTFMGSIYSSEFPDNMMSKTNYENGFRNLKINTSYAFFADYFLKPNRSGFHFGPSIFLYDKTIESNTSTDITNFKSIYPNIRIGYVYKPFKNNGLYLNPWFNFGKEFVIDGDNSIEGQEFSANKVTYVMAIHLGYQITF
jgi:hypothetical protein